MAEKPDTQQKADLTDLGEVTAACELTAWFAREVLPLEPALMQFLQHSRRGRADAEDLCREIYVRVYEAAKKEVPVPFDPATASNNGMGFDKDLSGNQLPNTPHITLSLGAQYSMPVRDAWAGTLRGDFYYQSDSYARIFNDRPYDQLRDYTNVNLALIMTSQDGWQATAYVKNVFDTTAITGAFLNSDDTALATNVFTTDPRLFGLCITKNW